MLHTQVLSRPIAPPMFGYEDLRPLLSRMAGDEKHSLASTSTLDVIWTLYDRILNVDPNDPDDMNRDRFYLSKGHGPIAYYAVLAAKGFIDPATLDGFASFDSPLGHHPDRNLIPGVEISSGSLGQGLALAVGATVGIGLDRNNGRVFTLMGDGELDEGSVHEAIAIAGRFELSRLTAIIVDNESSTHPQPGGIARRFASEGWSTVVVDGSNHDDIERGIRVRHANAPLAVIAKVQAKHV